MDSKWFHFVGLIEPSFDSWPTVPMSQNPKISMNPKKASAAVHQQLDVSWDPPEDPTQNLYVPLPLDDQAGNF